MTRTRHTWSEEDDIALLVAIDDVGGLAEHYERQGYARVHWWDAVAGALHKHRPDFAVTGSACRARWARLSGPDAPLGEQAEDAWQAAERMVAQWEAKEKLLLQEALAAAEHHASELGYEFVLAFVHAAERRMRSDCP